MARIHRALISVSDKTGIVEFARRLRALDIAILTTGGSGNLLRENELEAVDVADYTGFPEILQGRVKTLHPKVHGGLLARREQEDDLRELAEHGIEAIDMVVVNLYPFGDVILQPHVEMTQALEQIDIGGTSLIRAAGKNYTHVAVVTSPDAYDDVADELDRGAGELSPETHFALAVAAFRHTGHYDTAIADYLAGIRDSQL